MDRLVCGDVGFGKTEVALRAHSWRWPGSRSSLLVPTTLLARAALQTFDHRFADFPVAIAELSRFPHRQRTTPRWKDCSQQIDIVIGTHKAIAEDVKFRTWASSSSTREHRFGVRQKAEAPARGSRRADAHRDPIPRTLAMSLGASATFR